MSTTLIAYIRCWFFGHAYIIFFKSDLILHNFKRPHIALVADELTSVSLEPDADIINITPSDWQWKLRLFKPDFLFVESAWRGYKNSWKGKIASYACRAPQRNELRKLIDYCRKKNITTIFWNKEDPFHFDRFVGAAALFDVVYTTDSDSLHRYHALPHQSFQHVGVLMFASQSRRSQSEKPDMRLPGVAFLGGYYGNELAERSRLQEDVLYAIRDQGLIIFDRFWQKNGECSYPDNLKKYCTPSISPGSVANACRQYQIYLNFNTISQSPTMLSRRVFELASAGCPIISTPSVAMGNIFGDDIAVVTDGHEARDLCINLQCDAKRRKQMGQRVKEIVFAQHTWLHRLEQINNELCIY